MEAKKNLRFIGKVQNKTIAGKNGEFEVKSILINNPMPTKKDGSIDQYHQGKLVYMDKDGAQYLVKQLKVKGVSERDQQNGFSSSIALELGNQYEAPILD